MELSCLTRHQLAEEQTSRFMYLNDALRGGTDEVTLAAVDRVDELLQVIRERVKPKGE